MKILYLGNFNPFAHSTEKLIKEAFEKLGHKVITIDERSVKTKQVLDMVSEHKPDLFFFHKGDRFGFRLDKVVDLLTKITCKKAFWYFDPIWGDRELWMSILVPYVDLAFLTNETWIKKHTYKNTRSLKQGCRKEKLGKKRKEYECDIAFTGSAYSGREVFLNGLKKKYGDKFKIFNNVFGRDFYDLCASAKIMISPKFPADDFFWSNRIYMTIGAGGFMLHPRCEGLKEHFEAGVHYDDWSTEEELLTKIDYYLSNEKERKAIQKAGYEKAVGSHTYTDRCQKLIEEIKKS